MQLFVLVAGLCLFRVVHSYKSNGPELGQLWFAGPVTDHNLDNPKYFVPSDNPELLDAGWDYRPVSNVTYPFTHMISSVRLLGGWDTAMANSTTPDVMDVVFRNASTGKLQYRPELLFNRLDQWVTNGVALTVVLDNVPYALATSPPSIGTYGVMSAPSNFSEYTSFVATIGRMLLQRYGPTTVASWRFRVATEPNNPKGHWNASPESYISTYRAVVAGLRAALPFEPVVGPGNFAPENHSDPTNRYAGPFVTAVQRAFAADKANLPIGFAAASMYGGSGHPQYDDYLPMYSARAVAFLQSFVQATGAAPDTPLEFMEYGALDDSAGEINACPGAFGAAWRVATASLGVQGGLRRLFHWQRFSIIGSSHLLFPGGRWLAALANSLSNTTDLRSLSGALTPAPDLSSHDVNAVGAYGLGAVSTSPGTPDPFFVSVFAANRTHRPATTPVTLTFKCPARWTTGADGKCHVGTIQQLSLNLTTAPFDVLYDDLQKIGGLAFPKDHAPLSYPNVANSVGRAYVDQNAVKYLNLQTHSFQRGEFAGRVTCTDATKLCSASWTAGCPSTTVLLLG